MKTVKKLIFLCSWFLGILQLTAQNTGQISLYCVPDTASEVVVTLYKDSPVLLTGTPAEGNLYKVEYVKDYTAYIKDSALDVGNRPIIGSPVYLAPSESAPVLTHIEVIDEVSFDDVSDWTQIHIKKPVTLYFDATQLQSKTNKETQTPSANIARYYDGYLQKAKNTLFFISPPYPYELRDSKGNRIGYVDMKDVLLQKPIDEYLGKHIHIYGQGIVFEDKLIIRVKHLQQN